MPLKTWVKDPDQILASLGPTLYMYAPGAATAENRKAMIAAVDRFVESTSGSVSFLMHLTAQSKPPPADERREVKAAFDRCGQRLAGIAIVVEADGFAGSVLRSAVTMIFAMNRGGFQSKVFRDIKGASAWLADKQGVSPQILEELAREGQREFLAG
jgi:hypothetical protein